MNTALGPALAGLFIAIGLAAAGWFGSQTLVNSRTAVNTATVKGLSERLVEADRGELMIFYQVSSDLPRDRHYVEADAIRTQLRTRLTDEGVSEDQITASPLTFRSDRHFPDDAPPMEINRRFTGQFRVVSDDLDQIDALLAVIEPLSAEGIEITELAKTYRFTGLNDIKTDMLREATGNARLAASEFAKDAGVEIGGIQTATQGGFSIRDASDDRSETEERTKRVRVVTTITFYMKS